MITRPGRRFAAWGMRLTIRAQKAIDDMKPGRLLAARLTARQVDLLLAVAATVAAGTGRGSWAVGTGWGRWLTVTHALAGLSLLTLAPAKLRGSVRTGLKRRRATRWLSMLLGVLVTATVVLGVLHATGLWHGVGYWSALWTHVLLVAFVAPLLVWHIASRPSRPERLSRMAKPWPERPVSGANKSGKQEATQRGGASIRARSNGWRRRGRRRGPTRGPGGLSGRRRWLVRVLGAGCRDRRRAGRGRRMPRRTSGSPALVRGR